MLRTIPGVQYQADQDSTGGSYGTGTPNIGGSFSSTNILAVDGVVSNDIGTPNIFSSVTTLDAIGEVKVLLNSYQAEYAGNGGPVVQVVTRGGGREFHGSAYEYIRNDALNANDFFNNRNGVKRPRYRYNTFGGTLGGPVYIPGHWNQGKTKMFAFYNLEQALISTPGSLNSYTMPTALERQGDFSQTLDVNGKVIPITDNLGGPQFPDNVIPKNRLNPNGQALMNILPQPNFLNRTITGGNYNYQIQEVFKWPKRSQLLRLDFVPSDKDRFFVRGKTWVAKQQGYAVASGASPVGFFAQCYCFTEDGLATGVTHIFSPNVIMEFNTGVRHNREAWHPYGENEINKVLRSAIGYNLGQWYPNANARVHSALFVRRRPQRSQCELRQSPAHRRHRLHLQLKRQRRHHQGRAQHQSRLRRLPHSRVRRRAEYLLRHLRLRQKYFKPAGFQLRIIQRGARCFQ